MTWWVYVTAHSGGDQQKAIALRSGVDQTTISRWRGGQTPRPDKVAMFARAYDRPVLEAFIAAGFLTPEEANARPAALPSLADLNDRQLLDEIERRMKGERDARPAEDQKIRRLRAARKGDLEPSPDDQTRD